MRNIRFIGELTKFRIYPAGAALVCLRVILTFMILRVFHVLFSRTAMLRRLLPSKP
jgi:hypothetical protein